MACGHGAGNGGHDDPQEAARTAMAGIPHKVLVMSGKGGVGKTTVAVNLAYAFAARGLKVGIVDTDLHGPDVPLMTGVEGAPIRAEGEVIVPIEAAPNVRVLSVSSFLPSRDSPVIWRGPAKNGVIAQFLGQADWSGVDVLVVDCPPGTGDEPLSVSQMIPDADGVVIVTSPQGVSLLDSRKCVGFARKMELPVLGIVENFSGFECPGCGRRIDLFKRGGGEQAAGELGVPFLGRIPITEAMVDAGDSGKPLVAHHPEDAASQALSAIAGRLVDGWSATDGAKVVGRAPGSLVLAVTCMDESGLDAAVSGHFGQAPAVALVTIEDGRVTSVRCEPNATGEGHSCGSLPRFLKGLGVNAVVTGGMGARPKAILDSFGIAVATCTDGTVRDAVDAWQKGTLGAWSGCGGGHDHGAGHGGCGGH